MTWTGRCLSPAFIPGSRRHGLKLAFIWYELRQQWSSFIPEVANRFRDDERELARPAVEVAGSLRFRDFRGNANSYLDGRPTKLVDERSQF